MENHYSLRKKFFEYKYFKLDRLFGVLKTYELEMQQDEEIEKDKRKEKLLRLLPQAWLRKMMEQKLKFLMLH